MRLLKSPNPPVANRFWPPITIIHQPVGEITQVAFEHLENNIRRVRSGAKPQHRRIELDFYLVKRDSDAPPRGLEQAAGSSAKAARVARRFPSGSSRKPPVF